MRYILTFALLLGYNLSFGCMCEDYPSSSNIEEWIEDADLIIEGEYIKDIDWRSSDSDSLNATTQGIHIYFKVNKVIKGQLKSDTVAINQWGNGNCTKIFKKEEEYIVFGYEVKGFQSLRGDYYQKYDSSDDIPPQPPLDILAEDKLLKTYYSGNQEVNYWNEIANQYKVVQTSSCSAFSSSPDLKKLLGK